MELYLCVLSSNDLLHRLCKIEAQEWIENTANVYSFLGCLFSFC